MVVLYHPIMWLSSFNWAACVSEAAASLTWKYTGLHTPTHIHTVHWLQSRHVTRHESCCCLCWLTVSVTRTLHVTEQSLLLLCPAAFFLLWQGKMCRQYISHTPESASRKQLFINSALYRLLCTDTKPNRLWFCKLVFFIRWTKWILEASNQF